MDNIKPVAKKRGRPKKVLLDESNMDKTTSKKPVVAKTIVKKPTVAKTTVKKPTVAKTTAKKPVVAKTTAKKPMAAKTTVKKPTVAKTTAKKPVVAKTTTKKPVAAKTVAKKPVVAKTTAKNPKIESNEAEVVNKVEKGKELVEVKKYNKKERNNFIFAGLVGSIIFSIIIYVNSINGTSVWSFPEILAIVLNSSFLIAYVTNRSKIKEFSLIEKSNIKLVILSVIAVLLLFAFTKLGSVGVLLGLISYKIRNFSKSVKKYYEDLIISMIIMLVVLTPVIDTLYQDTTVLFIYSGLLMSYVIGYVIRKDREDRK